jgi:hypothetical protein
MAKPPPFQLVDLSRDRADRLLFIGLVVVSLATLPLLVATSRTAESDPFDSPLYWGAWIVFPAIAFFVAAYHPRRRGPLTWALGLVGPWMLLLVVMGTIGHDSDDGASFWVVGEVFLVIQVLWIACISKLGHLLARFTAASAV